MIYFKYFCDQTVLAFDRSIDFCQSIEGRKKIRNYSIPVVMIGGLLMIVMGATWAKLLNPECGTDLNSAKFSISTDVTTRLRMLVGNACPGYDWMKQKTPYTAGEYPFTFAISSAPVLSQSPIYVGEGSKISGPIGVALDGIPIYSPSKANIKQTFKLEDPCGGSNYPSSKFAFGAPITGFYHYIRLPGLQGVTKAGKLNFCSPSKLWYNESAHSHSPLAGFMADSIPIYGPYSTHGKLPTDLDDCGGHASDDLKFYHYHFRLTYPYSVNCLRGCADGSMNSDIKSESCSFDSGPSYDYSSLLDMEWSYGGGATDNFTNWTGPACLLAFGTLIFLAMSISCCCVFCVSSMPQIHSRIPMANKEEFEYDHDDNIL